MKNKRLVIASVTAVVVIVAAVIAYVMLGRTDSKDDTAILECREALAELLEERCESNDEYLKAIYESAEGKSCVNYSGSLRIESMDVQGKDFDEICAVDRLVYNVDVDWKSLVFSGSMYLGNEERVRMLDLTFYSDRKYLYVKMPAVFSDTYRVDIKRSLEQFTPMIIAQYLSGGVLSINDLIGVNNSMINMYDSVNKLTATQVGDAAAAAIAVNKHIEDCLKTAIEKMQIKDDMQENMQNTEDNAEQYYVEDMVGDVTVRGRLVEGYLSKEAVDELTLDIVDAIYNDNSLAGMTMLLATQAGIDREAMHSKLSDALALMIGQPIEIMYAGDEVKLLRLQYGSRSISVAYPSEDYDNKVVSIFDGEKELCYQSNDTQTVKEKLEIGPEYFEGWIDSNEIGHDQYERIYWEFMANGESIRQMFPLE